MQHPIPVDILRALLRLDEETGKLYWRERGVEWFSPRGRVSAEGLCAIWNAQRAGKEALTTNNKGHRYGMIFGRNYFAHRVIFAMTHGRWPEGEVDHRDMDKANNKPGNLREATRRENECNKPGKPGTSSFKGVHWHKRSGKWRATARDAAGKRHYLGRFDAEVDAARAYDLAAREMHGEFARLNFEGH